MPSPQESPTQPPARPRPSLEQLLKDFFIPRSFIDVIFIVICLAVAWYLFTYELPQFAEERACAIYWKDYICPCINDPLIGVKGRIVNPGNTSQISGLLNISLNNSGP